MDKVNRLGWTTGITLTAYGVRVGVRVNKPEALERVAECFPPGWKQSSVKTVERLYSLLVGGEGPRPGMRRFSMVYVGSARIARSLDLEDVFRAFESELHLYVAEMTQRRVFVHAGVVGWHGKAILIPGRSYSGKTTLVAELVRAGATYYSDEFAVLDSNGMVHPFARPLAIREEGEFRSTKHSVESIGGRKGVRPLPVGMVLVSKYKAGAKWRPHQLSAGQGALALMDNTVSIRRQPERAFETVERVVTNAQVFKGVRGEAKDIVTPLLERVGALSA
jgi:hypothetical protein